MEKFLDSQVLAGDTDAASSIDPTNPAHTVQFRSRLAVLEAALDHLDEETDKLFREAVGDAKSAKEKAGVLANPIDFCEQHPSGQADEITESHASPTTATILHVPSLLSSSSNSSSFHPLLRELLHSLMEEFHTGEPEACQLDYYTRAREQLDNQRRASRKEDEQCSERWKAECGSNWCNSLGCRMCSMQLFSADGGALRSAEEDTFDAGLRIRVHAICCLSPPLSIARQQSCKVSKHRAL
jgi:hypothetical protein